ncbi:cilia- and flagella-associated protein 157 isoform X2 [Lates calcarifer]|uniref:Cilia- and flagella-associated protein 157 n=1 Tax=Lates calcarifer TaxID=8187 RepID=A0A4W6G3N7_LATCA|nr:cilia- and flagella-associated protein 157 isoform X2 [Lates calcarifer]
MADMTTSDDREKTLYLIQIRHLDEQLERFQLKCDDLQEKIRALSSLCRALDEDKKDIAEYLKHCVAAEQRKVEELAERLESRTPEAERDREALTLQLRQQLQQLQDRADEHASVSRMQAAMLEEQEEQRMQLLQVVPDTESLKQQLVRQQREHEAAVHSLMMEAEAQRKQRARETGRTVEGRAEGRITQLVVEERAEHSEQVERVQVLLCSNIRLRRQKDALQGREMELSHDLLMLTEDISKITQRILNHKTEVQQLVNKCQQLEVKLKDSSVRGEHRLAEEDAVRRSIASVSEECGRKSAEVDELGLDLEKERRRRRKLQRDVQEAAVTLTHILTDSEDTAQTHRMQRLLEILESPAPPGTSPAPSPGEKPQTSSPKPDRAETPNTGSDPLFLLVRYRLGDLGLVPRPSWIRKPAPPTSSQLPHSRTPCSQRPSSTHLSDPLIHRLQPPPAAAEPNHTHVLHHTALSQ